MFSKKAAPAGLDPLGRYGADVFLVWDREDTATDLFLRVGLTLARALCVRNRRHNEPAVADFASIEEAILEIEKRAAGLGDIETWAQTIHKRSGDILKRARATRASLEKQAQTLADRTDQLKKTLDGGGSDESR